MRGSYINHQTFPKEHEKEENKKEANNSQSQKKKLERMPTEDINASAEAFIKNFRHHLLLQRLQSIENHKLMLAREK
ncbi:hypothetical protein AAZX31_08G208200 [Glycine max]|uniref:Uncharacterized protein n=2 Tax=Glycine subgen. Soja TaxID=1462606 RepID=I1KVC7_SOYBN|nr:hypothetical protein JHK87_021914 [Glycine soja]KAG5016320.1 hypothetical protein JHK85_022456 [Glycine max]KAG5026089.1 hypothetical protein JHK86_022003 [Glycine max]KAG5137252.1 hypothetical protein JHK82_021983 [Glycine max]KAH1052317.1 hypothetical protein GYH30_021924 [Glycine max]